MKSIHHPDFEHSMVTWGFYGFGTLFIAGAMFGDFSMQMRFNTLALAALCYSLANMMKVSEVKPSDILQKRDKDSLSQAEGGRE